MLEGGGHQSIDRMAPTLRPIEPTVMYQSWHRLLFLHWPVDASVIAPLLPAGLELDTYEGQAFVGLVPFTMTGVRPVRVPSVRGLSSFHEINVRTYVTHRGRAPGVWFFSLDAANPVAARLGRGLFHLPYHYSTIRMECSCGGERVHATSAPEQRVTVDYDVERLWPAPLPATCRLRYSPRGTPAPARPGSLEHFLIERYILYSTSRGALYMGRVHHTAYPVQGAELVSLEDTLVAAAGIPTVGPPSLIHYASRVDVRIYGIHRLKG